MKKDDVSATSCFETFDGTREIEKKRKEKEVNWHSKLKKRHLK